MRVLLAAALLIAACTESSPTVSRASPTLAATRGTSTAQPNAAGGSPQTPIADRTQPTYPPMPILPPGATADFVDRVMTFSVPPGDRVDFNPVAAIAPWDYGFGDSFVWTSTWVATGPLWTSFAEQGVRTELGVGRSGFVTLGPSTLQFWNDGPSIVTAQIVLTTGSR